MAYSECLDADAYLPLARRHNRPLNKAKLSWLRYLDRSVGCSHCCLLLICPKPLALKSGLDLTGNLKLVLSTFSSRLYVRGRLCLVGGICRQTWTPVNPKQ